MPEKDEEEDEGHFGDVEPSTMVVGRDDARHAELITKARESQPIVKPAPAVATSAVSTPVAKPSPRDDSQVKVPPRSIAGEVDAARRPARPRFPLALVLALVVVFAIAIAMLVLYR